MWKKVHSRMSSTTNTLEATDGHFNNIVTRRNSLWRSLTILVDFITNKTTGFDTALARDFRDLLKRSTRRSQLVRPDRMAEKSAFFGISRDSCGCAQAVHRSSSYRGCALYSSIFTGSPQARHSRWDGDPVAGKRRDYSRSHWRSNEQGHSMAENVCNIADQAFFAICR
jgi:hypothetical protein